MKTESSKFIKLKLQWTTKRRIKQWLSRLIRKKSCKNAQDFKVQGSKFKIENFFP